MRSSRFFHLCLLVALALAARAEEPPPVRVDFAYASRTVFRGIERAGDALQADLELSRDEWRGGVRTSQPLGHGVRVADVHGGYLWAATESVSIEASLTHGWYGDVPGGGVERSFEAGLAATFAPVNGFTPTLAYRHDFRFQADNVELALARSVALSKWGAFLEFNFHVGATTGTNWRPDACGPRRSDAYQYWGGEVTLPYRVGPHATVVAGLHAAGNTGRSLANGAFGRASTVVFWATLGVNLDF